MDKAEITNPHDKFFKLLFKYAVVFRSFVNEYLLVRIAFDIDLGNIRSAKNESVNKWYREHLSDLIFRTNIKNSTIPIFLLFEHKSYVEPQISMQLKSNMDMIEEDFRDEQSSNDLNVNIIPIVIYHGKAKWGVAPTITTLYPHLDNAEQYIPDFKYELFDISLLPDEEIKGTPLLRIALLSMKYIHNKEIEHKIDDILVIFKELAEDPELADYIEIVSQYIESAAPKDLRNKLAEKIRNYLTGGKEMSDVTEYFREQGREQGLEQGLERVAIEMIKNKKSNEEIALYTKFTFERINDLRKRLDSSQSK
jgi:predicted transposase/invertase (TIGR01784 family)